MQEKYTLNTALAAVVGLGCLAAVLYRVFLPAAVLPAVGLPAAAACSLLALAAEAYLSKGVPRRNWGLTLLLGALTFGLLPWAAGLTAGTEAVRFAVVGGAAFGALTFLFTSLRERLASGPSGGRAPRAPAGSRLLARQCWAGWLRTPPRPRPCWEAARLFSVALPPGRRYNEGKQE